MSTNNANDNQVVVNGDTSMMDMMDLQSQLTVVLLRNGGLKRIQAALQQGFDETGWSEDLRNYCTALFRSGAAKTYDDALDIIMRRINAEVADPEGKDDGVPAPNLSIPPEAKRAGVAAAKKELKPIIVHKK